MNRSSAILFMICVSCSTRMLTEGKALEERKNSIQSTLDKYEKIKSEGMTGGMLNGIVHASAKFGGPENLFAAINEFTSLEQFKVRQSQLKSECQEWQAKIRSQQVENASIA